MIRFIILVTGWNCSDNILKCYKSLVNQSYENWIAIFILDGATDGGEHVFPDIEDKRCIKEIYGDNKGAAYRRYHALQHYGDKTDVVLLLGMDDYLYCDALIKIEKEYNNKKKWMTYGNWVDQNDFFLSKEFLEFDEQTHQRRDYRKVKYRSTAPNTFYKFLFDRIPVHDFLIDGEKWIDSTTESEVMFSCLEMCGKKRIGIITDRIYHYNSRLPTGTLRRQGRDYKYAIYNKIILRDKKPLLSDDDFGK